MEYRVQRPSSIWIEATVEADSFEQALEIADERFRDGDFTEIGDTWEANWDRYFAQDEDGETKEEY